MELYINLCIGASEDLIELHEIGIIIPFKIKGFKIRVLGLQYLKQCSVLKSYKRIKIPVCQTLFSIILDCFMFRLTHFYVFHNCPQYQHYLGNSPLALVLLSLHPLLIKDVI